MNRMSQQVYASCVAIVLALVLASGLACSQSPGTPISPSGAGPAGTGAAADGSTLKVPAPTQVSPINNARTTTRQPTLIFNNVNGKYVGSTFTYEVEMYDARNTRIVQTTVNQGSGTTSQYTHAVNLDKDSPYTWRVRARAGSYFGPWSPSAGFITVKENRTPDPLPGSKLPLPNAYAIVQSVKAFVPLTDPTACADEYPATGWQWMDRVMVALRETDTRWGYNWRRRIVGSMSTDVINYHYSAGPDEGSFEVYTVKILRCQAPLPPIDMWLDITNPDGPGAMWTCARCPKE